MDKEPITSAGLESLKEELIFLKEKKRPEIVAAISEARSHGDLKENAEYHAAKEEQSHNEGRIAEINNITNLDIGCASSKPGYENVATQDELSRLNYFLNNVKGNFSLSIDTSNPIVAELALKNNFKILNDINGFEDEELITKAIEIKISS